MTAFLCHVDFFMHQMKTGRFSFVLGCEACMSRELSWRLFFFHSDGKSGDDFGACFSLSIAFFEPRAHRMTHTSPMNMAHRAPTFSTFLRTVAPVPQHQGACTPQAKKRSSSLGNPVATDAMLAVDPRPRRPSADGPLSPSIYGATYASRQQQQQQESQQQRQWRAANTNQRSQPNASSTRLPTACSARSSVSSQYSEDPYACLLPHYEPIASPDDGTWTERWPAGTAYASDLYPAALYAPSSDIFDDTHAKPDVDTASNAHGSPTFHFRDPQRRPRRLWSQMPVSRGGNDRDQIPQDTDGPVSIRADYGTAPANLPTRDSALRGRQRDDAHKVHMHALAPRSRLHAPPRAHAAIIDTVTPASPSRTHSSSPTQASGRSAMSSASSVACTNSTSTSHVLAIDYHASLTARYHAEAAATAAAAATTDAATTAEMRLVPAPLFFQRAATAARHARGASSNSAGSAGSAPQPRNKSAKSPASPRMPLFRRSKDKASTSPAVGTPAHSGPLAPSTPPPGPPPRRGLLSPLFGRNSSSATTTTPAAPAAAVPRPPQTAEKLGRLAAALERAKLDIAAATGVSSGRAEGEESPRSPSQLWAVSMGLRPGRSRSMKRREALKASIRVVPDEEGRGGPFY